MRMDDRQSLTAKDIVNGYSAVSYTHLDVYKRQDYSSYSRSIDGYDAEGQLTSAIQYVSMDSTELPVIYQVSGHGETALSGGFTEAIEKANKMCIRDRIPVNSHVIGLARRTAQ